jgi:hypothetical protein
LKDLVPTFSFNWTTWPFVEVGDPTLPGLAERLDSQLVSDLQDWCQFMLANFHERDGFSSTQAEVVANREYESLSQRLVASNVRFTKDTWWSNSTLGRGV